MYTYIYIQVQIEEMEDVKWFSREEVEAALNGQSEVSHGTHTRKSCHIVKSHVTHMEVFARGGRCGSQRPKPIDLEIQII